MASEDTERAMACDAFRSRIRLFLDGEMHPWDLEGFVDHATGCTRCEACLLAAPGERRGEAAAAPTRRRGR